MDKITELAKKLVELYKKIDYIVLPLLDALVLGMAVIAFGRYWKYESAAKINISVVTIILWLLIAFVLRPAVLSFGENRRSVYYALRQRSKDAVNIYMWILAVVAPLIAGIGHNLVVGRAYLLDIQLTSYMSLLISLGITEINITYHRDQLKSKVAQEDG